MYNALDHRPNVPRTSFLMNMIAKGSCWHFDAWLYRDTAHGHLFYRIETRRGGRNPALTQTALRVGAGGLLRTPVEVLEGRELEPATLQDKWLWPRYDELNEYHWRDVWPLSQRPPAGYRSSSLAFHYIRAPSLDPLADDAANLWQD